MLNEHLAAAPDSAYTSTQNVRIARLDDMVADLDRTVPTYLKIDAQGFEQDILSGAEETCSWITGVQIESSLVPLYAGQMLLQDTLGVLDDLGLIVEGVQPGFRNPDGRLLCVDIIAFRPEVKVPTPR
jgi:hypothetical protein